MDSKGHMSAPMCLIENREGELTACQEALDQLSKIQQPVVVVSIVGQYRTGKSYLMNKLAGKNQGFPLGSAVQATTKGIWMWCVPYPGKPDQTLLLLDTEGLGDVEKGDTQNDTWLFALTVLLSSTLVYNSFGAIDQRAMDHLHYVTELTERIKAKAPLERTPEEQEDSADFVSFFPIFIWSLRDFTLQLQLNGKPISADEYLEHALSLKPGDTPNIQQYNMPRKCIRFFFPKRKCFIFKRPCSEKNLHLLEEMEESELKPVFVEQAGRFCHYIYEESETKTIPGGNVVTGRLLVKLVEIYLNAIHSGEVPCVENAVLALSRAENSAAVQDAVACYVNRMEEKTESKMPMENVQELLDIHAECEEEAIQVFMDRAFENDIQDFQAELMKTLNEKMEEYCHKNELKSAERCSDALAQLAKEFVERIKKGTYCRAGGYKHFLKDQKEVAKKYRKQTGKAIMSEDVLQEFLKDKEDVSRAIRHSDVALTEKDKQIEGAKAEAAMQELQQLLQQQQQTMQEKKQESQKRSVMSSMRLLVKKLKIERKKKVNELNKAMTSKRMELNYLLQGGFPHYACKMDMEIQHLTCQMESIRDPLWFSKRVDALKVAAIAALPVIAGIIVFVAFTVIKCL